MTDTESPPEFVTSADGSRIAYEKHGTGGPALILVAGAMAGRGSSPAGTPLARLLAPHMTVISYDRRGRGASTGAQPSTVAREIEDIAALVGVAGGRAALFSHSAGCALALAAAASGLNVDRVVLYEPPFSMDAAARQRTRDYAARLARIVPTGDGDAAAAAFLAYVGVPEANIAAMRAGPGWPGPAGLSLAQDSAALDDVNGAPVPVQRIASITAPIDVIAGDESPQPMRDSSRAVADAARAGTYQVLAGQPHSVAVEALAPVVLRLFGRG